MLDLAAASPNASTLTSLPVSQILIGLAALIIATGIVWQAVKRAFSLGRKTAQIHELLLGRPEEPGQDRQPGLDERLTILEERTSHVDELSLKVDQLGTKVDELGTKVEASANEVQRLGRNVADVRRTQLQYLLTSEKLREEWAARLAEAGVDVPVVVVDDPPNSTKVPRPRKQGERPNRRAAT